MRICTKIRPQNHKELEMNIVGFRGRRRNLAWWRNKPITKASSTGMRNPNFRTFSGIQTTPIPAGYRYVGHCRCGHGPNAYYQTPDGDIIPAWQIFTGRNSQTSYPTVSVSSSDREKMLKERLERLQEEISEVTNQLEELEEQNGKKKRSPFKWRLK